MLIKALSQFEGTMLFVSHDRHFLAALSNRVLELTPEGVHRYDGGYTEYVARTAQGRKPGLQEQGAVRTSSRGAQRQATRLEPQAPRRKNEVVASWMAAAR